MQMEKDLEERKMLLAVVVVFSFLLVVCLVFLVSVVELRVVASSPCNC